MFYVFAIIALSLLIIIHEFGHYLGAVATGMKVDRFSVFGIGPVILRLGTWRGTEFVISAIPFGAYVHIVGMEADDAPSISVAEGGSPGEAPEYDPKDPSLFRNRPIWARMVAILGGPAANYLTAIVICFVTAAFVGTAIPTSMRIDNVAEPAAQTAGLQPGDELVRIADADVRGAKADEKIYAATGAHKGETVPIVVQRDGAEHTLEVPLTAEGRIGVEMSVLSSEVQTYPLGQSATVALYYPIETSRRYLKAIKGLITGETKGKVSGPVGIVKEIAKSAERGIEAFLVMGAFISTLLGLFNLLPLPALDGGRFMFLLWEAITRHPANKRVEEMIHGIGMLALLGLILYATVFNDIRG